MDPIRRQLMDYADPEYQKFMSVLVPNAGSILGVRMPILKKIARALAKEEQYQAFLREPAPGIFEELMLQGLVIGLVDVELNELFMLVDGFVDKIDNWSVCDTFCVGLRGKVCKNKDQFWEFIKPYILSRREFEARFGLVMANDYFISDQYIYNIFEQIEEIQSQAYYAQMALAWLISSCYTKFPQITLEFLRRVELNRSVKDKLLRKVKDSLQVEPESKERLKEWYDEQNEQPG